MTTFKRMRELKPGEAVKFANQHDKVYTGTVREIKLVDMTNTATGVKKEWMLSLSEIQDKIFYFGEDTEIETI